jgi:hypothetical protein
MHSVRNTSFLLYLLFVIAGRNLVQTADTTTKINVMQKCGVTKTSTCPFTVLSGTALIPAYAQGNLFTTDMCSGFIASIGSNFSIRIELDAFYKSLELSFMIGQLDTCHSYLFERTPSLSISLAIDINNPILCYTYTYSLGQQGIFYANSCAGITAKYITLTGPGYSNNYYALAKFYVNAICSTTPGVSCTLCVPGDVGCVCSSGSYCPDGWTSEIPCPAGSYCPTPSTILPCEKNFYCPAGSTAQQSCPAGSTSPAGSTVFASCMCSSPNYLVAVNSIFGTSNNTYAQYSNSLSCVCNPSNYQQAINYMLGVRITNNDTALYATNTLFIIRNPIFPQYSPLVGTRITHWTVTTTRACTIQPFWTRPSVAWPSFVTSEENYIPWGVGTAVTVPSAGTYTFPWVTSVSGRGSHVLDQTASMNLGWYTTEGSNCVATNFSKTGSQYLAILSAFGLPSWWSGWYFQTFGGFQGDFAISIHQAPSAVPSSMFCRSCDANYYLGSNGCVACSAITTSLPGSSAVTDCKCKPGYTESCTLCPEGSYISDSSCHTCSVGSYCPIGSFSDKPCAAGSYCPNTTSIVVCVNGSYCPTGSTKELACPAGFYCITPSNISGCEKNFYCPAGSKAQNPCPENSNSLAGSVAYGACECKASTYLLAYSTLFGVFSGYVGIDDRAFATNTLFIIRNPILPRYSPLFGTKFISWTVTTVKACTIQPFWTTPSRPWEVPTGEQNYLPWGVGSAVTVPSAGTYTFPWVVGISGRGTDVLGMAGTGILDATVMMNLGWYTTEGSNCVSSSFSTAGTQYLTIQTVSSPASWWNVYYFQTFGGFQGDFAISLNYDPTSVPSVMKCNNCSLNQGPDTCSSFCPAGSYFDTTTSICSLCPAGKYSTKAQSTQCNVCPTEPCYNGYYRDSCGGTSTGLCKACINFD